MMASKNMMRKEQKILLIFLLVKAIFDEKSDDF